NIVYTVGYTEGVDILRLHDPASECGLHLTVTPGRTLAGHQQRFLFQVTEPVDAPGPGAGQSKAVPGATVDFAGRSVHTDAAGRASITTSLPRPSQYAARATKPDYRPGTVTVVASPSHNSSRHH